MSVLHVENKKRLAQVIETAIRMGRIIEAHDLKLDEHERLDRGGL